MAGVPDQIVLPEPAAGIYAQTKEVLHEYLTPLAGDAGWWIGGGTVLAAQWRHRRSTDLDIFLPSSRSIAPLTPRHGGTFLDRMHASGARSVAVQSRSIKLGFEHGRIEITALDPVPTLDPRDVEIDGRAVRVLREAAIMTGKMQRCHLQMRILPRDVFDMCVASVAAPAALRCAVNHIPPEQRLAIAQMLSAAASDYRDSAAQAILEPAPPYAHFLQNGAAIAAALLDDESYDGEHAIEYSGGRATVTVRTRGGAMVRRSSHDGAGLARAMREMGLEAALWGPDGTTAQFIAAADGQIAHTS